MNSNEEEEMAALSANSQKHNSDSGFVLSATSIEVDDEIGYARKTDDDVSSAS